MNWPHLQAFVWLRWRLLVNHWRRAGALNAALLVIFGIILVATIIPVGIGSFVAGVFLIPHARPAYLMYAWDGLLGPFVLFWTIGLLTELQRNESLSIVKFLHLPVSVNEAFLLNYLSSLLRLSLIFFGPAMVGYALALVYVRGAEQWAVLPLLAAFLLMVTGLTYQFQGWLALLINNPRRRRAVVVGATMVVVVLCQLPQLANLYAPWSARRQADHRAAQQAELKQIQTDYEALKADSEDLTRRLLEPAPGFDATARWQALKVRSDELDARSKASRERFATDDKRTGEELLANVERSVGLVNLALPVGWLPLGVARAAEGSPWPALLGLVGMGAIGGGSLWRAYRTTLAIYRGQASNRRGRAAVARPAVIPSRPGSRLEARIPGLSEPVAAIALGGFWSLSRAPEVKLALLSPLIMGPIFGSMILQGGNELPASLRPLLGIGAIASVLFGLLQVVGNMFGIDRDGFRVFVLCAAPRRAILHGKNLTCAPAALLVSALFLAILQYLRPMRADHALAMVPQFVSMYLLFALLADVLSIYAPFAVNSGTLKPANPKGGTILLQVALFMVLFPLTQGLTVLPLGAELGLRALGWGEAVPICLLLTLVECAAIVWFYHAALGWLGNRLQAREQKILETVTGRKL